MPRINKIRIVNFAYNDDKRLILDETFEFNGKNGLVNFVNGGGKTVLIQAIMQPFVPLSGLGENSRSFEELFRKDKEPSYILIEWKLDNNSGYMTNGIAIKRNTVSQDDENTEKLDYFTFILESSKTKTNIDNISLSKTANNKMTFIQYSELKELISKAKGSIYGISSETYKKSLKSFNIDTREWKNVISKINSIEGGLPKLFENCKTSKSLMNDWILKSIKENLRDSTNVSELLDQTQKHIIKSRKKIEDKEKKKDLANYIEVLSNTNLDILKIKEIEDNINKSKNELCNLKYSLHKYNEKREEEIKELNYKIESKKNRLKEIKIEELSLEYYNTLDKKTSLQEEFIEVDKKFTQIEEKLSINNRLITSLKVADINKQCLDKEIEREEYKTKIDKLSKEKSEIDKELEMLGFTINTLYKEEISKVSEKIDKNKEKILFNLETLKPLTTNKNITSKRNMELNRLISSIGAKAEVTQNEINNSLDNINSTNMLMSIDENESQKEIDKSLKEIEKLNSEIELVNIECEEITKNIENFEESINNLNLSNNQLALGKNTNEQYLTAYKEEFEKLKYNLSIYGIENFSIGCKNSVIANFTDKISKLQKTIENNNIEIEKQKGILERLSVGGISINKDFISYLENKNITYILGSEYIKKSIKTEELRLKAIETNPLLPYGIILENKEIEYIKTDMPNIYCENPILIIERENLNSINIGDNIGFAKINDTIGLLCLYNTDLVIKEDIKQEVLVVELKIKNMIEEVENWENQKNELVKLKGKVEDFSYEIYHEDSLVKLIEDLNIEIKDNNNEINKLKNDVKELNNKFDLKVKKIDNNNAVIRNLKENIKVCKNIKSRIVEKKSYDKELIVYKEELKNVEKSLNELSGKIDNLTNENSNLNLINSDLKGHKKNIEEKQKDYIGYSEGELVEGSLEILIQRYKTLESKANISELSEYNKKVQSLGKNIESFRKKIGSFSNYDIVEYNFDIANETEVENKYLTDNKLGLSEKRGSLRTEIETKEKEIKKILFSIEPYKLKEKNEIGINPAEEIRQLNKAIMELSSYVQSTLDQVSSCQKVLDRIEDNKLIEEKYYDLAKKEYNEDYILNKEEIHKNNNGLLNTYERSAKELKDFIRNKIQGITTEFSGKNQSIDNSLTGLNKVIIREDVSFELYKTFNDYISVIEMLLEKIITDLKALENEEKFIIERYLDVASQYTEEINKIDKNSSITIQDKKLKMMIIKNMKNDETSAYNLSSYIKEQLERLTSNLAIEEEILTKAINKEFSIENVLINYCRLDNIKVSFLKVEENIYLSKERTWEEVITNNSGAEKFVSYFVLFSTLINYTRGNHLKKDIVSMALVMDNPFAAISSKHLLIPLFEFAKKSHIQLICFTDHNKNDILDRFDVIHKLIIKTMSSQKEFIVTEKIKEDVEIIDNGYYHYNEQVSLI